MNKPNFRAFAMEARLQLLGMVHRQAEKTGIHAVPLQEEAAYTWFSRSIPWHTWKPTATLPREIPF